MVKNAMIMADQPPSLPPLALRRSALPPSHRSMSDVLILAGSAGEHLAEEIAGMLALPRASCVHTVLHDGECSITINENVRQRDVFVVQVRNPAGSMMRFIRRSDLIVLIYFTMLYVFVCT